MSAVGDVMFSPSRKRPAPDELPIHTTPLKMARMDLTDVSTPSKATTNSSVHLSAPESPLSSIAGTMSPPPGGNPDVAATAGQKRKKRTAAEIEEEKKQKEAEREAKRIALEEKRVKKEEEERLKQEQKRKLAEEREEKRRERELQAQIKEQEKKDKQREKELQAQVKEQEKIEKQRAKDLQNEAKEQEKQRKVEEQEKKEKAQLRLHSFFAAKPASKASPSKSTGLLSSAPQSPSAQEPPRLSEYRTKFLPFTIGSNARLPKGYLQKFQRQPETIDLTVRRTSTSLSFGPSKKRGWEQTPVKDIMDQLQGTSNNPIDLTMNESNKRHDAIKMANRTAIKYFYFSQDVRPPFFGTSTAPIGLSNLRRLARNPRAKLIQQLDYDYDSEAEWEEEEGDDVGSDVEEEEEDDGEDDMEGFVDDTGLESLIMKRQPIFATDLTPVCSGIQWENEKGIMSLADGRVASMDLTCFEMEFLLRPEPKTVDPFSTAYWESSSPQAKKSVQSTGRPALVDKTKHLNSVSGTQSLKAARYIPDAELDAFKMAIDGQDLTKIAMIEHLKKLFPKQAKDAIVNTLNAIAERESKKADAKWRLKA